MRNALPKLVTLLSGILACVALAGCERPVIRGKVVDLKGVALPGVAVRTSDGASEAHTTGLGEYTLPYEPGIHGLEFLKNGYTSGHLALDLPEARVVEAETVTLWLLPQDNGVYFFEHYDYRKIAATESKPYKSERGDIVQGIAMLPTIEETAEAEPFLLAYRMPPYDVRLSRLAQISATPAEAGSAPQQVWASETSMAVELSAIDEPDRLLMQLRLMEPLSPGLYAVHWGALDGSAATDSRVFLFRVSGPPDNPTSPTGPTSQTGQTSQTDQAPHKAKPKADTEGAGTTRKPS